jgi:hypothetical protein
MEIGGVQLLLSGAEFHSAFQNVWPHNAKCLELGRDDGLESRGGDDEGVVLQIVSGNG